MNQELFNLGQLPSRTTKPRESGITMVMDKGLSLREAEDFVSNSLEYTDIIKLGFGTGFVTPGLQRKIDLYKEAGLPVYFGGTLFEAYIIRNQFEDYLRLLDKTGITHAEVSDGSIEMHHDEKCEYIRKLASRAVVLSEVGSKDAEKSSPPTSGLNKWKVKLAPVCGR